MVPSTTVHLHGGTSNAYISHSVICSILRCFSDYTGSSQSLFTGFRCKIRSTAGVASMERHIHRLCHCCAGLVLSSLVSRCSAKPLFTRFDMDRRWIYILARVAYPAQRQWNEYRGWIALQFFTGLFVQLTNPKIMVFCITALTIYALPYVHSYRDLLLITVILPFTGPIANLIWLFAGTALQYFFKNRQRVVNTIMAILLVFCAVAVILS